VKATLDDAEFYESLPDETHRRTGRQKLSIVFPGEKPHEIQQPRLIESPEDMQKWQEKVEAVEQKVTRIAMGDEPRVAKIRAIPHERHIWETLKRARTATEVRRAYSSSKIWLKSRQEFLGGGYHDWSWSPFPKALYEHADKFCLAKQDPRYPKRDKRLSGDFRRMEFLGRVMAGLSLSRPIPPSSSVEVLRKMKHSFDCVCWRCRAEIAPRYPRTLVQFLSELASERV
jgi:hypothetical protein